MTEVLMDMDDLTTRDGDNLKQLQHRIDQLERDLRLVQRKLRAQAPELDRELISEVVLEVLGRSQMIFRYDGRDIAQRQVTRTVEKPLASSSKRKGETPATCRRQPKASSNGHATVQTLPKIKSNFSTKTTLKDALSTGSDLKGYTKLTLISNDSNVPDDKDEEVQIIESLQPCQKRSKTSPRIKSDSESDAQTDYEQSAALATTSNQLHSRSRYNYKLEKTFETAPEVVDYMKHHASSRLRKRKPAAGEIRAYYNCRNEKSCPFRQFVLYPTDAEEPIQLYTTVQNHNHPVIPFGIPENVRTLIQNLVQDGISDPNEISDHLLVEGVPKIHRWYLENYLSTIS